jgi:aryl-alcohol dehydrogenase-like predicted oxidoreductase
MSDVRSMACSSASVPTFGTRKLERVTENLGAADLVLTSDDVKEIEQAASRIEIVGARLPEAVLKLSYR